MMRYLLLLSIFLPDLSATAQNLVPNSSFEKVSQITNGWITTDLVFEQRMDNWTSPNQGSPDILFEKLLAKMSPTRRGVDLSPHQPRTGNMMVGIKTYGCQSNTQHCKEYIQIKLKASIKKGKQYFVEFWVNPMSTSLYNNNLGMAFSDVEIQEQSEYGLNYFDPVVNEKHIIANAPNDWHRIATTLTADGNYDYILIGNFFTDEATTSKRGIDDIKYGYYLIDDVLVRPLQPASSSEWANVELEVGNNIRLNSILFATGKAELLPASFPELDQLATTLQENKVMTIQINGHTDNQGTPEYNLELSVNRALAVVDYLSTKGISKQRMQYEGFGESQPVSSNDTMEGQGLNRRVEFVILSK